MGYNLTCGNSCFKNALNKTVWCNEWRPPPIPEHLRNHLESIVWNDSGFKLYANVCDVEIPKPKTSPTTTSTTITTVAPLFTSTPAFTTATTTTTKIPQTSEASLAGGMIALVVLLIIIAIAVGIIVLWWYLWKRKRKRGSINSLPLKRYEDTNFLDNKARQNQCYTPSTNPHPDDKNSSSVIQGNHYGSFPPANGVPSGEYISAQNRNSQKAEVESQVEFDKMNMSQHSGLSLKNAYDNDNFMNDFEQTGTRSPGANSQTPLFGDMIDGPALPNAVLNSKTLSENSIHNSDKPEQNGSLTKAPGTRLPPIDLHESQLRKKSDSSRKSSDSSRKTSGSSLRHSSRKASDSSLRSPKKKKAVYLQRKSEPVEGIDDITQDMAGNRKSV